MWTKWYSPRVVDILQSDEIGWQGRILADISTNYVSLEPVSSVAKSQGGVTQVGSQSLVFRDFGIVEQGVPESVEIELRVDRLARIQDRTIQLWQSGAVGRNRARLDSEDTVIYSGDLAWWRVDTLNCQDTNFGVLVDLQPHSQYPSRDTVYVRSLKIRLNFA